MSAIGLPERMLRARRVRHPWPGTDARGYGYGDGGFAVRAGASDRPIYFRPKKKTFTVSRCLRTAIQRFVINTPTNNSKVRFGESYRGTCASGLNFAAAKAVDYYVQYSNAAVASVARVSTKSLT